MYKYNTGAPFNASLGRYINFQWSQEKRVTSRGTASPWPPFYYLWRLWPLSPAASLDFVQTIVISGGVRHVTLHPCFHRDQHLTLTALEERNFPPSSPLRSDIVGTLPNSIPPCGYSLEYLSQFWLATQANLYARHSSGTATEALMIPKLHTKNIQPKSPYAKFVQAGPRKIPAALALVYNGNTWACAPLLPNIPGCSTSILWTTRAKSATRGAEPRLLANHTWLVRCSIELFNRGNFRFCGGRLLRSASQAWCASPSQGLLLNALQRWTFWWVSFGSEVADNFTTIWPPRLGCIGPSGWSARQRGWE